MPRGSIPMSPMSAAGPLVSWIDAHGRWPHWREFRPAQGLHYATTYFRYFGVNQLSLVIAEVYAIAKQSSTSTVRTKPCFNERCGHMILDEGHHVRFCDRCRKAMNKPKGLEHAGDLEPALTRKMVKGLAFTTSWWNTDEED